MTLPPETGKGSGSTVCKISSQAASCPVERLALTTVLSFYKSDYFPSAFNKKKKKKKTQLWSLTHRLKTDCAGYRGWEFQQWHRLELFSNRKSKTGRQRRGGGAGRAGRAGNSGGDNVQLGKELAPGCPPTTERLLRPRSEWGRVLAPRQG